MRPSFRIMSIALVAGILLANIRNFQKSAQDDYLRFMAAGRAAGIHMDDATAGGTSQGVCQLLPPDKSALSLWTKVLSEIHTASQLLPQDPDYEFHDLTASLLHLISPRLPNSVQAIPREWASIQRVLEGVLLPRWQFLQNQSSSFSVAEPRPVQLVVMGGSVVHGINCVQIFAKKVRHQLSREECAWPHRLQQFFDRMTAALSGGRPGRLVEVHTFAMGGSNSVTGSTILEFDLLPQQAKNPDVIVHAYATNDMHLKTFQQGDKTESWREKVMTVLQEFLRFAQSPRCEQQYPPIILHLDDYLGNEQREILATTELSQAVHVLASYYGTFTAISYADVVRDWVYGDTKEFWFSPFGWYPPYKTNKPQKMSREIHPGMPMHMVIPWIIAYNLLNLFTTFCDRQPYHHDQSLQPTPWDQLPPSQKIYDKQYDSARTQRSLPLPALKGNVRFPGKPRVTPYGLPPPLTPDLSLQGVSDLWKNQSLVAAVAPKSSCGATDVPYCPFAWVSGLHETQVEAYFRENSMEYYNHGWEIRRHDDGRKLGFVPAQEHPGANLTMVFDASSSIGQVVVFYLKSYGEKWAHSRLSIRLQVNNSEKSLLSQELLGFHAKNTSEMYIERLRLPQAIQGQNRLRLEATFVGGTIFKIMGLLVCR